LDRLYARDPEAAGYGIYVVFLVWGRRGDRLPAPPEGIDPPETPEDLEKSLRSLIANEKRHCLKLL